MKNELEKSEIDSILISKNLPLLLNNTNADYLEKKRISVNKMIKMNKYNTEKYSLCNLYKNISKI